MRIKINNIQNFKFKPLKVKDFTISHYKLKIFDLAMSQIEPLRDAFTSKFEVLRSVQFQNRILAIF